MAGANLNGSLQANDRSESHIMRSEPYAQYVMLMLRWAGETKSDRICLQEIQQLRRIFEQDFGCSVILTTLTFDDSDPQDQLNQAFFDLIQRCHHSDGQTLLIVYYSGHGLVRIDRPTELCIGATYNGKLRQGEADDQLYLPIANFSQAARTLRGDIGADVLIILDYCYAGSYMTDFSRHSYGRCFEVMVAAFPDSTTPSPGPSSYTTLLMESLKEMREVQEFVAMWELAQKIMQKQQWRGGYNLHAVFLGDGGSHIVLAPPVEEALAVDELAEDGIRVSAGEDR